jgi:hypothetical protein
MPILQKLTQNISFTLYVFAPTLELASFPLLNYFKVHVLFICINICADTVCWSVKMEMYTNRTVSKHNVTRYIREWTGSSNPASKLRGRKLAKYQKQTRWSVYQKPYDTPPHPRAASAKPPCLETTHFQKTARCICKVFVPCYRVLCNSPCKAYRSFYVPSGLLNPYLLTYLLHGAESFLRS